MSDIISRQAAIHEIHKQVWLAETAKSALVEKLSALPSADIQPVQRGHWQEAKTRTYGIYECDVCKGWTYIPNEPRDYKFCPRCGARMDEVK